jgi:pSer/pThr/pTyr-binding forkhead associated (FHA) protein
MPRFIVMNKIDGDRRFELGANEVIIGRGEDADLVLPNVSVSRHHAKVTVGETDVRIIDLESRNATLVNGEKITARTLNSGDEVSMGKYVLVFLGDEREDRFYKGRFVEYLPEHSRRASIIEESTFAMSPGALKKMQDDLLTIRSAKIVLLTNSSRFWHPEDRSLTFGGSGMVSVEGMFTSGVVAELNWDGKRHVLVRHARLAKITVNDSSITEQPLRNGDRIRVGNTSFLYDSGK